MRISELVEEEFSVCTSIDSRTNRVDRTAMSDIDDFYWSVCGQAHNF